MIEGGSPDRLSPRMSDFVAAPGRVWGLGPVSGLGRFGGSSR